MLILGETLSDALHQQAPKTFSWLNFAVGIRTKEGNEGIEETFEKVFCNDIFVVAMLNA
jgi:hypothetical protein